MRHPALTFVALTLTALGLAPGAAHVLEAPVKLAYDPALYAAVTSTLYPWFGRIGGAVQVSAVVAVVWLAYRLRRRPGAWLTAGAALALVLSLGLWGSIVAPVNGAWQSAGEAATEPFVAAYADLRPRWEWGHVAAFGSWLLGWLALAGAVVRRLPAAAATA